MNKASFHSFNCFVPGFTAVSASSRDIVVNVTITVNAKHDYKVFTVVGPKRPAMQSFNRSLEQGLASVSHFWVSRFSDSVKRDFKFTFQDDRGGAASSSSPVFRSIAESSNQSYKSEEAAYYYFYKILSNKGYLIGQQLAEFTSTFLSNFPSVVNTGDGSSSPSIGSEERMRRNSLVDLSLTVYPDWSARESSHRILNEIELVISQFDANYDALKNPSSALSEDLLPRLRPSVERFVFEGIGKALWSHYRKSFQEEDRSFRVKAIAIRAAHGDALGESCGVRPELRYSFEKSVALVNELQTQFDKSSGLVPNFLIQKLLSVLISVKTEVLMGSQGQRELESMDDIAPIFLFVVLSASELASPNALYHFLLDTMREENRLETEGRIVALLEGATRLVMNDWEVPESPPLVDLQ